MKNKIIDILSENIEQLDKEEIAAALEIPKKHYFGDGGKNTTLCSVFFSVPKAFICPEHKKTPTRITQAGDMRQNI